jgi:type IV secretory pathway VirB2 component (pilin)
MLLARRGLIRYHAWIQSFVILANLPVILIWMVPSYLLNVAPYVPGYLSTDAVYFPIAMLVLGTLAEGLGVFVVLVAGTNLVPAKFRFRRYKLWMRTVLVLWWAVFLLGFATFYSFYGAP